MPSTYTQMPSVQSAVQPRLRMTGEFEDISLFDPKDINEKYWFRQRVSPGSRNSQDSATSSTSTQSEDAVLSTCSAISTPSLASDASSLRSSLSSFNSSSLPPIVCALNGAMVSMPSLPSTLKSTRSGVGIGSSTTTICDSVERSASAVTNAPGTAAAKNRSESRRRSVPALVDNTSMASLTIKAQQTRSRKQRELEFEADQGDDIWPGDNLMFNVPMSPALFAQQKLKHSQISALAPRGVALHLQQGQQAHSPYLSQQLPHRRHRGPPPLPHHTQQYALPSHGPSHHSSNTPPRQHQNNSTMRQPQHSPNASYRMSESLTTPLPHVSANNSPISSRRSSNRVSAASLSSIGSNSSSNLQQQVHHTSPPKHSSCLRNSLASIDEHKDHSSEQASEESRTEGEYNPLFYEDNVPVHDTGTFYAQQPGYSPAMQSYNAAFSGSHSSFPAILSRKGSMADMSLGGLDLDASDLTLEFCRIDEERRVKRYSEPANASIASISSLAMSESEDAILPSPSLKSCRVSEDGSHSPGVDSRRSSLTRPENLPPKSPEEERKHMKEYEKLLRDAAHAEKKKQQKHEEEAKKRAQQVKLDVQTWKRWLAKDMKSSVSSDLKWRGLPEKVRGSVWSAQLASLSNNTIQSVPIGASIRTASSEALQIRERLAVDSEKIWPECAIFGVGRPFHEPLINVVTQFLGVQRDVSYCFEVTSVAALLLLYMSEDEAVNAMLILLRPGSLPHAVLSSNERLASATYVSFDKIFDNKFEGLARHFRKQGVSASEVLNPLIAGLFTTVLPTPECAARFIDVYIFESDSFLLRASLGLLRINEAYLYSSKEDIHDGMLHPRVTSEDALMSAIRNVTRK